MRIDVKKFLFVGVKNDLALFFNKAQETGGIQFIHVSKRAEPLTTNCLIDALKILRSLPIIAQETLEELDSAEELANRIISLQLQLERLRQEQRELEVEQEQVRPFGDFSKNDITLIEQKGHCKVQFFYSKQGELVLDQLPPGLLLLKNQQGIDYFVAINQQETQYDKLTERNIGRSLVEIEFLLKKLITEIDLVRGSLEALAKYRDALYKAWMHFLNVHHLDKVKDEVQWDHKGQLFSIMGWVPVNKIAETQKLVQEMHAHMEEIAIESSDNIPTYIENSGFHRVGEDVMGVYDTPSNTDEDPSAWVLGSFAFFFAFIVGDGGFGLIFLATALYLRYRYSNWQGLKQRLLSLLFILGFACVAWGCLTNAFFGIEFAPDHPIRKVSLLNWLVEKKAAYHFQNHDDVYQYWLDKYPQLGAVEDPMSFIQQAVIQHDGHLKYEMLNKFSDSLLMEMALLVGCVHVIVSLLRYSRRNWNAIGWVIFILGGYLYCTFFLQSASIINIVAGIPPDKMATVGLCLLLGGFGLALLLSIIQHKLAGALEMMHSIQIFADILSYVRLYALALAGAMVMSTINEAASATNYFLGAILIVCGYSINLVLSIMSGIIHGLRLNFIEWYHYSFEGGGKPFKPLRKMEIEKY